MRRLKLNVEIELRADTDIEKLEHGIADMIHKIIEREGCHVQEYVLKRMCWSCGVREGKFRWDRGLSCGVHCDECFENMVHECRSRSW